MTQPNAEPSGDLLDVDAASEILDGAALSTERDLAPHARTTPTNAPR